MRIASGGGGGQGPGLVSMGKSRAATKTALDEVVLRDNENHARKRCMCLHVNHVAMVRACALASVVGKITRITAGASAESARRVTGMQSAEDADDSAGGCAVRYSSYSATVWSQWWWRRARRRH